MAIFKRRITQKINKALAGRPETALFRRASEAVNSSVGDFAQEIPSDPAVIKAESEYMRGYLGLYPDASPSEEITYAIVSKIKIRRRGNLIRGGDNEVTYRYSIVYPQRSQTYNDQILMLPWISKTWVEAIEKGLGNMENFLFRYDQGRSELGIQTKNSIPSSLSGESKDEEFLDRLRQRFSQIMRSKGLTAKR